MFVKEGEALDVLKASPMMGRYVTDELITMSQLDKRHASMFLSPLNHFLGHMRATSGKGMGTMLTVSEGEKIIHEGSAIFDDWELQDWLTGQETKEANWIVGEANSTVLVTGDGSKYVYRVDHSDVSIRLGRNAQEQLSFVVRAKTNGMIIDEQKKDYDLTKPKNMNEMEKIFSQEITRQIKAAVYKSQKVFKADYLGFGEALKRNNPQVFAKLDWDEVFPDIPINVEVTASVTRFGLSP
jgi:spore germination protein KC